MKRSLPYRVSPTSSCSAGAGGVRRQPSEAPQAEPLPVEFVSATDFSQLTAGVKNAPKAEIDDAKPLADKVGDGRKPVKQLAPKVADKPEIKTTAPPRSRNPSPAENRKSREAEGSRTQARSDRRRVEEGRSEAEAGEEAAGIQARSDRGTIEERRGEEAAVQIRRQPGGGVARSPRAAASGGDRRNAQRHVQSRRAERARRASCRRARSMRCGAAERVLESAAGRRCGLQALCHASRSVQARRFPGARTGGGRSLRRRRSVPRSPRAPSARCCRASRSRCSSPSITICGKTLN
jgi:hypothetical protein